MKTRTTVTIDPNLLERARELKLNVSDVLNAALYRECEMYERNSLLKALDRKVAVAERFIKTMNLWNNYENYKYKDFV